MTFSVEGKRILVTGANRGIGKGFVEVLLAAGAGKIYAAARDLDNLKEIVAIDPEVISPIELEVTDSAQVQALGESIDGLDVLINNAGIATGVYTTEVNAVDVARQEMEVNLFGPMAITQVLLPKLKASDEAAIINISSIAGISNFPSLGPYSTTKAALHSFTQGLRADLRGSNIRVLGVYPGPTDTRLAEGVEMPKPSPDKVAVATLESLGKGTNDVFPDDFANHMYSTFLAHPRKLEEAFAEMTSA
jgi:NAD(P)-dependent dehydrogenase (short-subunit alcohol dehydrogenase family)